jgi:long-chain acyl-CoA synthetase
VTIQFGPDREILVFRDAPMCQGYFQCAPGENESTFIEGGVATGDIGWMDGDGYLHLVGRKKETIVTSGGEKLHPEVLEAEVAECDDVERVVILGTQGAHSLTAVVVPRLQDDRGARERIRQAVWAVNERHRNAKIGNVLFTDVKFTRDNGLLRPNLKVDRRRIAEYFHADAHVAHQIQV